jgi:hypothetical protein
MVDFDLWTGDFPGLDTPREAYPKFAGERLSALQGFDDDDNPTTWPITWDLDGDGTYVDGHPSGLMAEARAYSIGARAADGNGAEVTTRKTFRIGTRPPVINIVDGRWKLTADAKDPEGRAIAALEWDLDGDRAFDDAAGTEVTPLLGKNLVGLKATDANGDIGITYIDHEGVSEPVPPAQPVDPMVPRCVCAPTFRLKPSVRAPKLGKLVSRGLTVDAGCSLTCRTTVVATVDKRTAKRLKLRSRQLGRATGAGSVTVKLTAKARRALSKTRSVKLTLAISAVDGSGKTLTATRTLTIKR